MLAYSAQDLILEPFAGLVFGRTPGESTLASWHTAWWRPIGYGRDGDLNLLFKSRGAALLRLWIRGERLISAVTLFLPLLGRADQSDMAMTNVFLLGTAGGFAVAAIGAMMVLPAQGIRSVRAFVWDSGAPRKHCVRFRWFSGHSGSGCHPLLAQ